MTERLLYSAAVNFEAARHIAALPDGHRSGRVHGHSFLATVRCTVPDQWAGFPGAEVDALRQSLADAVAPLDYADLNTRLDLPTDENLARWIGARLPFANSNRVGVQSTPHEGVDLDADNRTHIWRRYDFQSAHQLPNVPPGHKCGRMHGHGFEVILHAEQASGSGRSTIDHSRLDALWAPLFGELDHAYLNEIDGLDNPTSEVISAWIWNRLKPQLPELSWVTVYETASCGAHFDGSAYRIWKEMTLDSAVRLKHAPEGDKRQRIHGHTYTLRLHLHAPLDEVMGWTVDFGDVKAIFEPIFKRLDHHPLHEMDGLADADVASIARWVRQQASPHLPQLDRIDLYETCGCGVILSWGNLGPALPI